mmetsp:Transcript_22747/g.37650  ORF Transcript_22747/g.37650 Transcript_22747/m.37650 type:complete len:295 (+) Transcript_22747:486-1370(+)
MAQDIEHQVGRRPLTVRRMLDQINSFVGSTDRRCFGRCCPGEILACVLAAHLGECRQHVLRHLTGVKRIAPLFCDTPQYFGLARGCKKLTDGWDFATHRIKIARDTLQCASILCPIGGNARGHRHTGFGIVDGGSQHRVEPEFADLVRQRAKSVHRAGDCDGVGAVDRNNIVPRIAQIRGIQCCRCPAGSVECLDLAARIRPQNETIATKAGHLRLANPKKNRTRDGGIHGIAARFQDLDGCLRGQRVRSGTHAGRSQDGRPPRKMEVTHRLPLWLSCHTTLPRNLMETVWMST